MKSPKFQLLRHPAVLSKTHLLPNLLWPATVRQKLYLWVVLLSLTCFILGKYIPGWVALLLFWIGSYVLFKKELGNRIELLFSLVRKGAVEAERIDPDALGSRDEIGRLGRSILDMARQLRSSTVQANDRARQLDELFQAIGEGVALLDENGRVLKVNKTILKWVGWYGETDGRNFSDIVKSVDLSRAVNKTLTQMRAKSRALRPDASAPSGSPKGAPFEGSMAMAAQYVEELHLDGPEAHSLRAKLVPIADISRKGMVLLVYLFDVTEMLQTEKMRREFFANVSHELKTPISAIQGYAEVLRDMHGSLDLEQYMRFLSVIERNAIDLTNLIDDMVTISRLESGALLLERREYDLVAALERVFETCKPKAQEANVDLRQDVSQDAQTIHVDAKRFDSVLLNLVDNGVKYNRRGGYVKVSARRQGNEVQIFVEDNGMGIPAELSARVFERFFRVDKSHTRLGGGTGLGLAIVKHVVSAHGGRISVKSELDSGTVFKLTLPFSTDGRRIRALTPI
jgi:two-component system phosphate regulon sensor histidine kinase PhoR